MTQERTKLRPSEVAQRWGMSPDRVLGWIRRGELRAIDISPRGSAKPRFLIDVADLAIFEQGRQVITPVAVTRRRRRPENVIKYF